MKKKVALNWSGGKDAALALHNLKSSKDFEVGYLLTSLSAENNRISMHGIRNEILDLQAERINLPLKKFFLKKEGGMKDYNQVLQNTINELKKEEIYTHAFGDIFLEDIRNYRINQLKNEHINAIFPLWSKDSMELIRQIEVLKIEAIIVCVNEKFLSKEYLGKKISSELIQSFPPDVDPCGENGEYHTLVTNAPFFADRIKIKEGIIVHQHYPSENNSWDNSFYFLDILPDL